MGTPTFSSKTEPQCIKLRSVLERLGEAEPIQLCDHRDALKTALGEVPSPFPPQHHFQPLPCWQQIPHIVSGVGELRFGQLFNATPVTALGTFVEFDANQFLNQVFQAMPWRVSAGKTACDLGAEHRVDIDRETAGQGCHIEPGEVEHLLHRRRLHQLLQPWSLVLPQGDPDAGNPVLPIGDLHQTKPVPAMHQTHGLRIHRKALLGEVALGPSLIQVTIKDAEISGRRQTFGHGSTQIKQAIPV